MNIKKSTVIPVINIQGQNCTGCATSTLCSEYPSIKNVLLQDIIPGFKLEFIFHPNIMTASGNLAMEILENTAKEKGLNTKQIQYYLNFFKYGCPPHGGLGIGPARMIMKIFNIENVREATFLYRGVKRLTP